MVPIKILFMINSYRVYAALLLLSYAFLYTTDVKSFELVYHCSMILCMSTFLRNSRVTQNG